MNNLKGAIELSELSFILLVLLSGVFSPIVAVISCIWEVLEKWL